MAPASTRQRPGTALAVSRWSRSATATTAGSAVALAGLAVLPYLAGTGIARRGWSLLPVGYRVRAPAAQGPAAQARAARADGGETSG